MVNYENVKNNKQIIGKYMALIVLAVAALALFVPQSSKWIDTSWVNYLLMVVMFGMGLTMLLSYKSLITDKNKKPSLVLIYEMSVTHF